MEKQLLEVPSWIYSRLNRWHHLSFLKVARHHPVSRRPALSPSKHTRSRHSYTLLTRISAIYLYRTVERNFVHARQESPGVQRLAATVRADRDSPGLRMLDCARARSYRRGRRSSSRLHVRPSIASS